MRQLKISRSITSRESISLEKYLQEIGKVQLLNPDAEGELCRKIRKGDKKALEQLIKANLRFVVSVAKQFQGQGLSLADMVNEGNIGLICAAERFDESKGFKFISFAVWWIRQSILLAISQQAKMVRVPLNKMVLRKRIEKTASLLEQELERAPSVDELADAMNLTTSEIDDSFGTGNQHVSLDAPAGNEEEGSDLVEIIENPNAERVGHELDHRESLKTEISRALNILTDRQREVICYFFGIGIERPLSLEDIAIKYFLTPERVRQIKDKALLKLKANCNFDVLRSFL